MLGTGDIELSAAASDDAGEGSAAGLAVKREVTMTGVGVVVVATREE